MIKQFIIVTKGRLGYKNYFTFERKGILINLQNFLRLMKILGLKVLSK